MFSPYQVNPLDLNPLRDILSEMIDFDVLRKRKDIKLFVSETKVRTCKLKVFRTEDLGVDALLASACLPMVFKAVEIDGEQYWDGGYLTNPAISPLIHDCVSKDVLVVQINPMNRPDVPTAAREILNRVNEVSLNSTLAREMSITYTISQLIEEGKLHDTPFHRVNFHMIVVEEQMSQLGAASKSSADWKFLSYLYELGVETTDKWWPRTSIVSASSPRSTWLRPIHWLYTVRDCVAWALPISILTTMQNNNNKPKVAVIGGGPGGLMAAEVLLAGGAAVDLFDAMPSAGRKFLMAGRGGLNITHSEPLEKFLPRYGNRRPEIEKLFADFGPDALRAWMHGLGIETFVGSSGRVFPLEMKAAPLLRTWLRRLRQSGLTLHMRHKWEGFDANGALRFFTPSGPLTIEPDATILALGGGSWPQLGSDGAWMTSLAARDVPLKPLLPSNCGFDVGWSDYFKNKFAGTPVKSVTATLESETPNRRKGEFMITETGVEGGLIYGLSALGRDLITVKGAAVIHIDLVPVHDAKKLLQDLSRPRGKNSLSNYLRKYAGIDGVKAGLLREVLSPADFDNPGVLASTIKGMPLRLRAARPLGEAISTAGGVMIQGLDDNLMTHAVPGVFCAGEMLDWEAPTGGYLLTACFASGRRAGQGALTWLESQGLVGKTAGK